MTVETCTAPQCTEPATCLVRLSLRPPDGYADPIEGHQRFAVCDEHLDVVCANEAAMTRVVPMLAVHVTRFA